MEREGKIRGLGTSEREIWQLHSITRRSTSTRWMSTTPGSPMDSNISLHQEFDLPLNLSGPPDDREGFVSN